MSDGESDGDDEWEEEYRRSLDDDRSDSSEEDSGSEVVPQSPVKQSPVTDAIALTAVALPTKAALVDHHNGSHVLQALDEVWAQLGDQRSRLSTTAAWTQHLGTEGAIKGPLNPRSSSAEAWGDTLQRRLHKERARDAYGATVPSSTPVVSERWLVCQLLLLYQRLDSQPHNALYVWSDERQVYELRQRVCTPHLSTSAVESLTADVAEHVTLLQRIHNFITRHCNFLASTSYCLQAFGHSAQAYLHTHEREVWLFENEVHEAASERLTTVLSLRNHMQPHTQYVRMLYQVIEQFVTQSTTASNPAEERSRLLSILYAEYEVRSLLTDSTLAALSLCLLLDTLVPYIEALDKWTVADRLGDGDRDGDQVTNRREPHPHAPLGTHHSADSQTHLPSFLQPVSLLILCSSENERLLTTLHRRQADVTTSLSTTTTPADSSPLLQLFRDSLLAFFPTLHLTSAAPPHHPAAPVEPQLTPSVEADTAAGSTTSAELEAVKEWLDSGDQQLGFFSLASGPLSAPSFDLPSLSHICPAATNAPTLPLLHKPHHFPVPSSTSMDPLSPTPSLLSVVWVDPYIAQLQQQSTTESHTSPPVSAESVSVEEDASLSDLVHATLQSTSAFVPPQPARMLDACLLSHIRDRYIASSQRVLHALLHECELVKCLSSLRSLYLSYDGVLVSDLLSAIRELSGSSAGAGSMTRLQDIVNECATSASSPVCSRWFKRHPITVSSTDRTYSIFSLSLAISSSTSPSSPTTAASSFTSLSSLLQRVTFRCEIPWPLNGIVTADHVRQYDAVFHFLLQLNCALHTLARLPALLSIRRSEPAAFSALPHPLSHAFYLLRAAVHHSVAVLQSYVSSQATGSAWDELVATVSLSSPPAAQSSPSIVQSLHSAHSRYGQRVLLVCLLAPSMAAVMSAVQRLLAVVAEVEQLAGMVSDYLHTTIDEWQPVEWEWSSTSASQLAEQEDESLSVRALADASAEAEQRAVRRRWRMALSEAEQEALRVEYDAHKDGLYARCQRRCEEVRDEYQHTVVFLLMVLAKIVHTGAHPHLAPLLLNLNFNRHFDS